MIAYTTPAPARKSQDRDAWMQAQVTQAIREDQQRPARITTRPAIAFYAFFDGVHGQALRDSTGACWFFADSGGKILLHDTDSQALQLLGRVDLTTQQHVLDTRCGGLAHVASSRRQEV
jgi:hypothetical protein